MKSTLFIAQAAGDTSGMTMQRTFLLSLALTAALPAYADVQTIALDGRAPGTRFDGIGVVDGGGATSVLLKDYPEPQRSQILDLMYKPKFGASVSALIVEIPGDGNSTQGSMPSHRHTRADVDYGRGYTWWVLREARRRNPALTLDAAAWSAPGWIDNGHDFFSPDGADYYVSWLKGLRDVYGLELDAIGSRNERGVSYDFAKTLRARLDAGGFSKVKLHSFDNWPDDSKFDFVKDLPKDAALRQSIDIISAPVGARDGGQPGQADLEYRAARLRGRIRRRAGDRPGVQPELDRQRRDQDRQLVRHRGPVHDGTVFGRQGGRHPRELAVERPLRHQSATVGLCALWPVHGGRLDLCAAR
jgi:hypothetical protein